MKNFGTLSPINNVFNYEKTHFQSGKTQKFVISQEVNIPIFEIICKEQMTGLMKNHTKHDIEP